MIVEPTKVKPRLFRSSLMASDWALRGGISASALQRFLDRATVDEAPLVRVEAAELGLHVEERLRVLDRRCNLRSVAHDPRICEQSRDLPFLVASDLPRVEPVEGAPVRVSLAQDRAPAQPRLGTFKNEELEQHAIVVYGNAPFFVVVGDVQGVGP